MKREFKTAAALLAMNRHCLVGFAGPRKMGRAGDDRRGACGVA